MKHAKAEPQNSRKHAAANGRTTADQRRDGQYSSYESCVVSFTTPDAPLSLASITSNAQDEFRNEACIFGAVPPGPAKRRLEHPAALLHKIRKRLKKIQAAAFC